VLTAAAQDQEPAVRLDPVIVTVTRTEQRAGDAPADVTVLTRQDIDRSPSQTLDDLLRQVPGFSLFRRTSSVVGHPTTQGVSLRGIGPSGTSRALVLLDGVPINDPFGGWVYWDKIPLASIEQVEVVRGGGHHAPGRDPRPEAARAWLEVPRLGGQRELAQPQDRLATGEVGLCDGAGLGREPRARGGLGEHEGIGTAPAIQPRARRRRIDREALEVHDG